ERGVNRVTCGKGKGRADRGHERTVVLIDRLAGEVLLDAGMGKVIGPNEQVGHPEQLGPIECPSGDLDLPAGDLYVQRLRPGPLECGREIDRQDLLARRCRYWCGEWRRTGTPYRRLVLSEH